MLAKSGALIVALVVCRVAAAAQVAEEPQQEPRLEPYAFSFNTNVDGGQWSHEQRAEANGRVTGFYTIQGDDGRSRRVQYVADKDGYRATVTSNEIGVLPLAAADAQFEVEAPSAGQLAAANISAAGYESLVRPHLAHEQPSPVSGRQQRAAAEEAATALQFVQPLSRPQPLLVEPLPQIQPSGPQPLLVEPSPQIQPSGPQPLLVEPLPQIQRPLAQVQLPRQLSSPQAPLQPLLQQQLRQQFMLQATSLDAQDYQRAEPDNEPDARPSPVWAPVDSSEPFVQPPQSWSEPPRAPAPLVSVPAPVPVQAILQAPPRQSWTQSSVQPWNPPASQELQEYRQQQQQQERIEFTNKEAVPPTRTNVPLLPPPLPPTLTTIITTPKPIFVRLPFDEAKVELIDFSVPQTDSPVVAGVQQQATTSTTTAAPQTVSASIATTTTSAPLPTFFETRAPPSTTTTSTTTTPTTQSPFTTTATINIRKPFVQQQQRQQQSWKEASKTSWTDLERQPAPLQVVTLNRQPLTTTTSRLTSSTTPTLLVQTQRVMDQWQRGESWLQKRPSPTLLASTRAPTTTLLQTSNAITTTVGPTILAPLPANQIQQKPKGKQQQQKTSAVKGKLRQFWRGVDAPLASSSSGRTMRTQDADAEFGARLR